MSALLILALLVSSMTGSVVSDYDHRALAVATTDMAATAGPQDCHGDVSPGPRYDATGCGPQCAVDTASEQTYSGSCVPLLGQAIRALRLRTKLWSEASRLLQPRPPARLV